MSDGLDHWYCFNCSHETIRQSTSKHKQLVATAYDHQNDAAVDAAVDSMKVMMGRVAQRAAFGNRYQC